MLRCSWAIFADLASSAPPAQARTRAVRPLATTAGRPFTSSPASTTSSSSKTTRTTRSTLAPTEPSRPALALRTTPKRPRRTATPSLSRTSASLTSRATPRAASSASTRSPRRSVAVSIAGLASLSPDLYAHRLRFDRSRPAAGSAGRRPTQSSPSACSAHPRRRPSSRRVPSKSSSRVSSSSSGRWLAGSAGSAAFAASTAAGEVSQVWPLLVLVMPSDCVIGLPLSQTG
jgi:hypothetical protein